MTRFILVLICLVSAWAAAAAPQAYRLDAEGSTVGFTYFIGQSPTRGTMPVRSADIALDLQNLGASRVRVDLNAAGTRAGFVFATQAVRGETMLDTGNHPVIRFTSERFEGDLSGASVVGLVTIRGVTKRVRLKARLLRRADQDPADLSRLIVELSGRVNRHDFGASGFPGQVGPFIDLAIRARIVRVGG